MNFEIKNHEDNTEMPDSVLQCFNEINAVIAEDYVSSEGGVESCTEVAIRIARKLLAEGKKPFIMEIVKIFNRNSGEATGSMFPLKYKDKKISWGTHIVCCCDGTVFDPILEKPVSIGDYTKDAFGEDIEMQIVVSKEEVENFTKRLE